jgi:hypothetical protein
MAGLLLVLLGIGYAGIVFFWTNCPPAPAVANQP